MRRFLTILLAAFALTSWAAAQEQLTVSVAAPKGITDGNTASVLISNLRQALVLNDAASDNSRYVLNSAVSVLSKDVTATAPPRYITDIEVSLFIIDSVSGEYLSQTSLTVKGIASNDKASLLDAVKKIKARDPSLRRLINQARDTYNQKNQQL